MKKSVAIAVLILLSSKLVAQDTLPQFNIRDINTKKILVTWINPFGDKCIQLSVQRSYDSLRFFSTFYSAPSPELPQNGVVELKQPKGIKIYYRIFYVLDGGAYFFSASQRGDIMLEAQQLKPIGYNTTGPKDTLTTLLEKPVEEVTWISVYKNNKDSLVQMINQHSFKRFRDSILYRTKDTVLTIGINQVILKTYIPKPVWRASPYVFTNHESEISINIPQVKFHHYRLEVLDENGFVFFEIKQLREGNLILDKSNFLHEGWFSFNLYEDEKLKEHNKFYVPK